MTVESAVLRPRSLAGATVAQAVPAMRDDRAGRAALDLAVALLRSGARTLVIGGGGVLVGELQAFGGEWIDLDLIRTSPLRRRGNVRKLAGLIRSENIELVHAHGMEAARCALPATKGAAMLLCTYMGAPPAPSWRPPPQQAQARGHAVLACSDYSANLIGERHRVPRERIIVVPRGVDTEWFSPAAVMPDRVAALRHAWRIRPEARVVLAPGRLVPSQGQFTLIDAARSLVNGGLRGVVFVIAADRGDETYGAELDARIAAQGLSPIFRRVGHCVDMPAAYATADLVVLPTERASTFSMIAAEAQAMGRPVIVSQLGAMAEMVLDPGRQDEPRTGWLVRSHDPLALAQAIADALALGPRPMQEIRIYARQFAETMFSPDQVAAATLSVYEWLLQSGR